MNDLQRLTDLRDHIAGLPTKPRVTVKAVKVGESTRYVPSITVDELYAILTRAIDFERLVAADQRAREAVLQKLNEIEAANT